MKIAGVDEAGRGSLAGPVVVAAVILPSGFSHPYITDSKKLSPEKRVEFFSIIQESALDYSIMSLSHRLIDKYNIFKATMLGMKRAITRLSLRPDKVRIDGNKAPDLSDYDVETIVKGDSKYIEVGAASILAKVTRDRIMTSLDRCFPDYHFGIHKGYATQDHYAQIFAHGASVVHRKSFNLTQQEALF